MPVRDGQHFLAAAIGSILGQSLTDLEFIVVDDGSTDATGQILEDAAKCDGRLRVLTQPPAGIVVALEAARAVSRGSYIARMDADDVSLPHRLAVQADYLDHNPATVAVGGQVQIIDELDRRIKRGQFPISPSECLAHLEFGAPFCHPAVMMRAEPLERSGGYRPGSEPVEDLDLWLRLSTLGDFANLDEVILNYRVHAGSTTFVRANANAVGAALAFVSHKYGADGPAHNLRGGSSRNLDWQAIEHQLPSSQQKHARMAYLRELILNGGIAAEPQRGLFLKSIPGLVQSTQSGVRKDIVAFMLLRAIYQFTRAGQIESAGRVLLSGTYRLPLSMGRELVRSLARRL